MDDGQLSVIIEAVTASIAYVDRTHRVRLTNAAFRAAFGTAEDVLIEDVLGVHVHDCVTRALAGERVAWSSERGHHVDLVPTGADGCTLTVHVHDDRLEDGDGRDELIALLGHELRNPLAPIITALDVMEYRNLVGCERERDVIRRQALHLSQLVDDLLDVAHVRSGKVMLQKRPVDVRDLVAAAVDMTSPLFEQRSQRVTVDVPDGLVVDADAPRMTQVLVNVLTNAAIYTQARGHVTIAAAGSGSTIKIDISDDGPGLAPSLLGTIFEPFFCEQRGLRRTHGGLGLGLPLARTFTELHGGTVVAHSDGPGKGACFTIELPQLVTVLAVPLAKAVQASRLLLVDDNADAAHVLADLLRDHGYEVAVAFDAPAALALAAEFRPSIALLDIGLPVMDGYELARHLRTRLPTPPRLVAVSGYGDKPDPTRSLDAGFDVHLGKPVDFDKLVSVLGTLEPS